MNSEAVAMKPRGVLEIVDAATDLLRRRPRDVVLVAAISVVPVVVFSLLSGADPSTETSGSTNPFNSLVFDQNELDIGLFIAQAVVGSLLFSIVTFAMARLIVAEVFSHPTRPGVVLGSAFRAFPKLFVLWVLVHAAEVLGLLALGVGFILAMVALMVTVPVLASEPDMGAVAAFRRSWRLTRGARGHVLGVILVLLILNVVLSSVLVLAPEGLLGLLIDGWPLTIASTGLQAVATVIVEAVVSATTVLTYLDLRVRREGLDIDLRLRAGS